MLKNYLVVLKIYEFDSAQQKRFYKHLSSIYPWSIQISDNVLVIQTKDSIDDVERFIYECSEQMKEVSPDNEKLFEDKKAKNFESLFQIQELFICELGNHIIRMPDSVKTKYLKKMLSRKSKQ